MFCTVNAIAAVKVIVFAIAVITVDAVVIAVTVNRLIIYASVTSLLFSGTASVVTSRPSITSRPDWSDRSTCRCTRTGTPATTTVTAPRRRRGNGTRARHRVNPDTGSGADPFHPLSNKRTVIFRRIRLTNISFFYFPFHMTHSML